MLNPWFLKAHSKKKRISKAPSGELLGREKEKNLYLDCQSRQGEETNFNLL